MLLLVLRVWLHRVAGWPVARERVVPPFLSLFFQPSLLVLVLVVFVGEVTAGYYL